MDSKYEERAKRFISRTPGSHDNEQTIAFLSELYRVESGLIDLEEKIDHSTHWLQKGNLRQVDKELRDVSERIFTIQRAINSPDGNLNELLDIDASEVDESAVSEILTQLGWEWLPRELDRLYTTQSRVTSKLNAKKQRILTNRIVFLSLIAIIFSSVALGAEITF